MACYIKHIVVLSWSEAIFHLIGALLELFLSFPDVLEVGQSFSLLLLAVLLGLHILGSDSLSILSLLLHFNRALSLALHLLLVTLLLQVELVEKLLGLELLGDFLEVFGL